MASWLHELMSVQQEDALQPACVRGKIADDATAVTDPVYVTVEAFDGGVHRFGPCPWPSRVDAAGTPMLPNAGDLAWISEDEQQEPVILNWWPYEL